MKNILLSSSFCSPESNVYGKSSFAHIKNSENNIPSLGQFPKKNVLFTPKTLPKYFNFSNLVPKRTIPPLAKDWDPKIIERTFKDIAQYLKK